MIEQRDIKIADRNVLYFVTYIIEQIALAFYSGNQLIAYKKMRDSGFMNDMLIKSYAVEHSLSTENILNDYKEYLEHRGIAI
jgi:hypothetical protein